MKYPTRVAGDSTLLQALTVEEGPCTLTALWGHNNGDSDLFLFASDKSDFTGRLYYLCQASAGLDFAFALPAPVSFDKLYIGASSNASPDTYTAAAGTPMIIQAVLAA